MDIADNDLESEMLELARIIEEKMAKVQDNLRDLFRTLPLTPEDKKWVELSARRIRDVAWDSLCGMSDAERLKISHASMALAIGIVLGDSELNEAGIDAYLRGG